MSDFKCDVCANDIMQKEGTCTDCYHRAADNNLNAIRARTKLNLAAIEKIGYDRAIKDVVKWLRETSIEVGSRPDGGPIDTVSAAWKNAASWIESGDWRNTK